MIGKRHDDFIPGIQMFNRMTGDSHRFSHCPRKIYYAVWLFGTNIERYTVCIGNSR